jgi:hypothetical protein
MNLTRNRDRRAASKLLRSGLPLMTLATLLALSSAATSFAEGAGQSRSALLTKVVGRGHLTGTRELQQVVTWRTSDAAHLGIESIGRNPRTLWQANDLSAMVDINSVQVADLDGDSIPEVLSLWWRRGSAAAVLRVFHWDRTSQSFAELPVRFNRGDSADKPEIRGYSLRGNIGHRRIVVYRRATVADGEFDEFELRGSEIVSVGGGSGVTTHSESGIEGKAVISPVRPGPIREGQSDTAPFQTTLVILRASDGSEVKRIETGSDGRFRVVVPPGTYLVGPPRGTGRRLPRAGEETVTVVSGRFAQVTINFDSGMR